MEINIENRYKIYKYFHDPLLKNSIYIILTNVLAAGSGLIFWILAARLYSANDVGVATSMISSMSLLILLSRLGMDFSIIRFFPTGEKSEIISTSIIITTIISLIFGIIFILGIKVFSPDLNTLKTPINSSLYLIFLAANSITVFTGISFIADRKALYQLIEKIFISLRVFFLIPLVFLGSIGILSAVGISFIIAFLVAVILLRKCKIKITASISKDYIFKTFNYSFGNYLAGIFISAPSLILPILVLNTLGAESAAYYYISYSIASVLFIIPNAIGTSLFVEGSYGENLREITIKSTMFTILILVPLVLILYFFGSNLLEILGLDYSIKGFRLLQLMLLATFFVSCNYIYFGLMRVQKKIKNICLISGLTFILLVAFSYLFMHQYGLTGVGYSWIISYGIGTIIILFLT